MSAEKVLWFTTEQPRSYYLVPDDAALPDGVLRLRSLRGEERSVDAAGIASFVISEEKVKTIFRADMEHILAQLPDELADVTALLDTQSFDVQRLLAALPPSVELSQADVSTLAEALREVFAQSGTQVQSPEEFLAHLEAQGPEGALALVQQVEAWLAQGEGSQQEEVRRILERLNLSMAGLVESDRPHYEMADEEREKYRQSARAAIAKSLRRVGFHPRPHQQENP